ncbi:hypothetical protein OQA88_754 [Cercophora sp. LCS_1]
MSWDCYCAICGGPFAKCQYRAIKQTKGGESNAPDPGNSDKSREVSSDSSEFSSGDTDESEYGFGTQVYDEEVITAEEARWTETLFVIGYNANTTGAKKAFISGPGVYNDRGRVHLEVGDDTNYPSGELWRLRCYYYDCADEDLVFPFHWPCYELLARALTGTDDTEAAIRQVDNDVLYTVMQCNPLKRGRGLSLDYGINSKAHEQWWLCIPGCEFVVAPFGDHSANSMLLRATISSNSFQLQAVDHDLGPKVKNDPFRQLPYDIVHAIVGFVWDNASIMNLCQASWSVHCTLRASEPFWRGRIKTSLACLFELHHLIANDHELLRGKSFKGLLLALDSLTRPKRHIRGPFMGLANRRHAWGACEQIANLYFGTNAAADSNNRSARCSIHGPGFPGVHHSWGQ